MVDVEEHRDAAERAGVIRALLRNPMITSGHPMFGLARRHAEWVRAWFARECGWPLTATAAVVRLRKQGIQGDGSRGAEISGPLSRRRYVLVCLALAALERSESQITLGRLSERLLGLAGDPRLSAAGVAFTLGTDSERRDLAAVAKLLLKAGVLKRVAGDEQSYVHQSGDALYDVERHVLASVLVVTTGPSLVNAKHTEERIAAVTAEVAPDSDDARNRAIRHRLSRRLLDDPVLYYDDLDRAETEYLSTQRGPLLRRLTEATGLVAEVRAEGIALIDPTGDATDFGMPEEGTEGHVTLLIAEYLAAAYRAAPGAPVDESVLEDHLAAVAPNHSANWRRDSANPEQLRHLLDLALARLAALRLVGWTPDGVVARPALARYAYREPIRKGDSQ
jgi:uncharacterized protein (TIGR02678 family)